jgi:hypothetical protein
VKIVGPRPNTVNALRIGKIKILVSVAHKPHTVPSAIRSGLIRGRKSIKNPEGKAARGYYEQNRIVLILLIEGLAAACEVSMSDLHEIRNPNPNAGIDAVGWLFSALVAAIIAVAALIAHEANDTMVANAPVSHVVAR